MGPVGVERPVPAVVLAAGASTRFGSPKQRLLLEPVLERVRAARSVGEIVVVLGAHDVDVPVQTVRCPEWKLGPGASLRCGLAALADAEAAVVVLADGPGLHPEAIDRIVRAWRSGRDEVLAASYGGHRGHPVLIARSAWEKIPESGARELGAALIRCDDLGDPGDVDYADDLPVELRP